MLDIFQKWTTATKVTLLCGQSRYVVEVDRRVDIICFENGWNEFTHANELKAGQRLEFVFRGNHTFEVYIDG